MQIKRRTLFQVNYFQYAMLQYNTNPQHIVDAQIGDQDT